MSPPESKRTFFRQGAWMLVATFVSGIFLFAVHVFGFWMPDAQYGLFATLLQFLSLLRIPSLGLQTVFAQQAAAAIQPEQQHQLTGAIRTLLLSTFVLWLGIVVLFLLAQSSILTLFKIHNPAALWVTVLLGLPQLWMPILGGTLQGRQNFLWLGWAYILNGAGRFLAVAIIVILLGGQAAGAVGGALIGTLLALGVTIWQTRDDWRGPSDRFEWLSWFRRVVPLTLGLGVSLFMLSADMVWVRTAFAEDQTGMYARASLFGRGLVMFTIPLASVMFPKIVRSVALAHGTNVLMQALGATALLGGLIATVGTAGALLVPPFLEFALAPESPVSASIRQFLMQQKDQILLISHLAPWCLWCMLPLPLSNVLINNLMARQRFGAVPWLVLIALCYAVALFFFGHSMVGVLQILGSFNMTLLLVLVAFTSDLSRLRRFVHTWLRRSQPQTKEE